MTLRDFLFTIIGGLIVWVLQQFYLNRRERQKEKQSKLVRPLNADRILPADIFSHLVPRNSIALMREMLGSPVKHRKDDFSVFLDEQVETNSYLYVFKNGYLKVTSKDNESIDNVTVKPTDKSIWVPELSPFGTDNDPKPEKIGEAKVSSDAIGLGRHSFVQSRWDACFALQYSTGPPLYLEHTYFGFAIDERDEYFAKKDPSVFIGKIVDAISVSDEVNNIFYIFDTEVL